MESEVVEPERDAGQPERVARVKPDVALRGRWKQRLCLADQRCRADLTVEGDRARELRLRSGRVAPLEQRARGVYARLRLGRPRSHPAVDVRGGGEVAVEDGRRRVD